MDARLLDEIAAAATVAPIDAHLGGWWCKAAPDLPFRRANAVLPPVGAGDDPVVAAHELAAVRRWYHDRGQRLIVQVSTADPGHAVLDRLLAQAGLDIEAPVHVMVGVTPERRTTAAPAGVVVQAGIDERWADACGRLHGAAPARHERTRAYGRMLERRGDGALGASLARDGTVVGVGFGVLDRGWLGIFGMATAIGHRRQGVATAVVRALQQAAGERGTYHGYLQVEIDNPGAIALYEALGFARHHRYHYRSEGALPS